MVHQIQLRIVTSDITGTAGTARFKSGGGLEISQITESAGYVVVGGSGTYTDKFEVIGNVKVNACW
jgi:hypothetical protein